MNKDIPFSGFSTSPSDYDCIDGLAAANLNLIPEDGALKPLLPSPPQLECLLGGSVQLIHHVDNQDNYIILRPVEDELHLFWLEKTDDFQSEDDGVFIQAFSDVKDVAAIGNTIAISSPSGISYLIWRNNNYIILGDKPPFVNISFGLVCQGGAFDSGDITVEFDRNGYVQSEENANAVYGFLLPAIRENITSQGLFYMPFFVRYAFRLYDGSYAWHSAPILMLPSVIPPVITNDYNGIEATGDVTLKSQLKIKAFALYFKICSEQSLEVLQLWKDVISGIDVFVSQPIFTYNQADKDIRLRAYGSIISGAYYDWYSHGDASSPSRFFIGHYADDSSLQFVDHFANTDDYPDTQFWKLPLNKDFHSRIKSTSNFYSVAFISLNDIAAMECHEKLPLLISDLDTLATRPTLTDDYQSHCSMYANCLFAYNSRLNAANIRLSPAKPFSLTSSVQATSSLSGSSSVVNLKVYSKTNGILTYSQSPASHSLLNTWDWQNGFPRYIFYPDANAYKLELSCGNDTVIVDLSPHDFLNGAYFYGSFAVNPKPSVNAPAETAHSATSVSLSNKIYTSEVNNPFFFRASGINTVGSGEIIGISSAAKAMSQGQFGQFPLYAFASDGVWALEVSSTGSYTAKQPITRDVCSNPSSITQLDNAVLFATNRGIMLLSGSNSKCISENIDADSPFDILSLPGVPDIIGIISQELLAHIAPFSSFLMHCGMLFDYTHQRVIVYNPDYPYAYVLSLRSNSWSLTPSSIVAGVNAYPHALAMDRDGTLRNLSIVSNDSPTKGLFVSRPIKLDNPDILKTVSSVFVRGYYRHGHVACALFGSRNLISWHRIRSSVSHHLSGFSGTPFKYFRLLLLTSLDADESISGASFRFTHHFSNRPR